MRKLNKFLILIVFISMFILTSCKINLFKASKKTVRKVHEIVEKLEPFENEITYITTFSSFFEVPVSTHFSEGRYSLNINATEGHGFYEYEISSKTLYKDEIVIEENIELNSIDDFTRKVIDICDPTSYCISINEVVPFIKDIFLNTNKMNESSNRGGVRYYYFDITGETILKYPEVVDIIQIINENYIINADDIYGVSLLITDDFSYIYPEFSIDKEEKDLLYFLYS